MSKRLDPSRFDSSRLFGAIGERHRLGVLSYLMDGSRTVEEIMKKTNMEKTLLSKHLRALRDVGLVTTSRSGRHIIYSINSKVVGPRGTRSLKLHCCEIRLKKI